MDCSFVLSSGCDWQIWSSIISSHQFVHQWLTRWVLPPFWHDRRKQITSISLLVHFLRILRISALCRWQYKGYQCLSPLTSMMKKNRAGSLHPLFVNVIKFLSDPDAWSFIFSTITDENGPELHTSSYLLMFLFN